MSHGHGHMDMENIQAMIAAQQAAANPKPLVEFRAGILNQRGTTVSADKRKGKLVLIQSEEGLMHLQWILRPSNHKEFDLTIVPGGAKLEKIPECKDGRVYLLQFSNSNSRRWFWMQEPTDEKDKEWVDKINELIRNPPQPQNPLAGMMGDDAGGAGGYDQAALMQMLGLGGAGGQGGGGGFGGFGDFGGMGGLGGLGGLGGPGAGGNGGGSGAAVGSGGAARTGGGAASGGAATGGAAPQQQSGAGAGGNAAQQSAAAQAMAQLQSMAAQMREQTVLGLNEVMDAERLIQALADDDYKGLEEFLPSGQQTPEDLRRQLRSPQLQQTIARMSATLNSAQFAQLMASLGLTPRGDIGVRAFLQALEE